MIFKISHNFIELDWNYSETELLADKSFSLKSEEVLTCNYHTEIHPVITSTLVTLYLTLPFTGSEMSGKSRGRGRFEENF